ncbi:hypothetical protein HDU97_003192 [Phlyctochytrium planicorne]|nr:hypothetical protein HDU97_003192 [Phlyctochytrium planicorne]
MRPLTTDAIASLWFNWGPLERHPLSSLLSPSSSISSKRHPSTNSVTSSTSTTQMPASTSSTSTLSSRSSSSQHRPQQQQPQHLPPEEDNDPYPSNGIMVPGLGIDYADRFTELLIFSVLTAGLTHVATPLFATPHQSNNPITENFITSTLCTLFFVASLVVYAVEWFRSAWLDVRWTLLLRATTAMTEREAAIVDIVNDDEVEDDVEVERVRVRKDSGKVCSPTSPSKMEPRIRGVQEEDEDINDDDDNGNFSIRDDLAKAPPTSFTFNSSTQPQRAPQRPSPSSNTSKTLPFQSTSQRSSQPLPLPPRSRPLNPVLTPHSSAYASTSAAQASRFAFQSAIRGSPHPDLFAPTLAVARRTSGVVLDEVGRERGEGTRGTALRVVA